MLNTIVFVRFTICGKVEIYASRGRLRVSFWEVLVGPGITLWGFFRVPERSWNLDGHLGNQTYISIDF